MKTSLSGVILIVAIIIAFLTGYSLSTTTTEVRIGKDQQLGLLPSSKNQLE